MRIMLDTNILISAGVFRGRVAEAVKKIADSHRLVISSAAINELHHVTDRKFPHRKPVVERFIGNLPFELYHTPLAINIEDYPHIRDPKDYPILASAIHADVDILISGDKDFQPINITRPEIMTISEFMEKYD